ncbi:cobalamin biosynthesis protein [Alsobacter sp. SYSU M60028]|uniref:Cobalamin biosynthesis protein n=1 Tax=Alsobacter ponti TaxID=2962936 RepID=A0ABT1LHX4_9HYPH|nr:cobalamin biosynthesis protein [Alsobacter ponti]MCP8939828.1 cobalamin biosynthesis protein [Alsobacter ponti]
MTRLLAIGVGCRAGCPAETIAGLVRIALERAGGGPAALFTSVDKQTEPGIREAAMALRLPLAFLPRAALQAASPRAETRSERVVALFGVPSMAETAALAGAGPSSTLVVPRLSEGGATCAVARSGSSS